MYNQYLMHICWLDEWLNSHHYAFSSFHFFFFLLHSLWNFPDWRSNLCLLQWKFGVLTTGSAGNSLNTLFLTPDLPVFWLCIWIPIYHLFSLWRTCFELSLLFWCQKSSWEWLLGCTTLIHSWPLRVSILPLFHLEPPQSSHFILCVC